MTGVRITGNGKKKTFERTEICSEKAERFMERGVWGTVTQPHNDRADMILNKYA